MSASKKIGSLILRIAVAVAVAGLAFFALGFLFGYICWFPQMRRSRVMQAVDVGWLFVVASLILDPILIVRLISHMSKRRKD